MTAVPVSANEEKPGTAAQKPAEVARIAPNAVQFRLDNGLQVVVIPDRRAPVVTHMIWYRVGAADEETGQSGIAHFLEHLMFKGTDKHPDGAFSERISEIGGEENAFTSADYTAYFQRVAKEHLGEMMAYEADRMTGLVLSDEVVLPERDVVLEERRSRIENDPGSLLSEALSATLYKNHPYGRPVIGWQHEIRALDRQTALDFYQRYYTPNNAILVVAGDVSPEEVRTLAGQTYGQIEARPEAVRAPRPAEPPMVGPQTLTVRDEKVREPTLQRAFPVPSSSTADDGTAEALSVLADIVGGGSTSRFYDNLVRGKGLATYAGAYYQSSGVDDTRFVIYGIPKPGVSLHELEAEMERVIAEIAENGVSEKELTRAKRSVVAEAIYSQDSQQSMARIVGSALINGRSLDDVQTWPQRIQSVTAEQVRDAAAAYLDPEKSVTGYLEPRQKKAEQRASQGGKS
jgi:zinc protease